MTGISRLPPTTVTCRITSTWIFKGPKMEPWPASKFANHDAELYGTDVSGRYTLGNSIQYGHLALTGVLGFVHGQNLDTGDNLYHMMPTQREELPCSIGWAPGLAPWNCSLSDDKTRCAGRTLGIAHARICVGQFAHQLRMGTRAARSGREQPFRSAVLFAARRKVPLPVGIDAMNNWPSSPRLHLQNSPE